MSHVLASHNDDIKRLIDKGYAVAFDEKEYLVVRDVPYLDQDRKLCQGAIVSKFVDQGNNRISQQDHQVFFAGGVPHGLDGKPIPNLGGGPTALTLGASSSDVVVQRSFSNKPPTGAFTDFFAKVESYVNIIGGPAIELHAVSPLTFRTVEPGPSDSPFKFRDTLTSRAEIGDLNAKFHHDVVAIIGLGGTGAYVLDFIAKTPVREVRGFDHDFYHVHNAYRSPGRLANQELGKPKAEVLQGRYENFRRGVTMKRVFVDASTKTELEGVTFAFVCVDKGPARAGVFDVLIALGIPFIDVGMGLARRDGALEGMVRTTHFAADNAKAMRERGLTELVEHPDDEYRTQIQIAELNALNAAFAVVRFKQLRGFYRSDTPPDHFLVGVGSLKLLRDG